MTNQERITSHNALIDQAIAKANALPDAGSGGGASIETCTVTVTMDNAGQGFSVFGTNENGAFEGSSVSVAYSYTTWTGLCQKGSSFSVLGISQIYPCAISGDATKVMHIAVACYFDILGDCTLEFTQA